MTTIITNNNLRNLVNSYIHNKDTLPNDLKMVPIGNWNVSQCTDFSELFENERTFNESLENWDISNAPNINMSYMFSGCKKFNQPLNNWNVSNVTNMRNMFSHCHAFNQNLNSWNTSNVENMSEMFSNCYKFNQPLDHWNVSRVINMEEMFNLCNVFNQNLSNWDVSNVIYYNFVFSETAMSVENWPFFYDDDDYDDDDNNINSNIDSFQVHNATNKINFNKLNEYLQSKINVSSPNNIIFPQLINNTITQIINDTINDNTIKTTLLNQLQNIMTTRLNNYNYDVALKPEVKNAIFYSLEYAKLQPVEFKQMYAETFVKDCVNAYNGNEAQSMSCAKGAIERVILSLTNGCITNPENPEYAKIIEIIESNPEKVILEYIQDWYKLHSTNKFPVGTTTEQKKADLKAYLLNLLPNSLELINNKITETEEHIGFDDDNFEYNGGKRRKTLKRKEKKAKKNIKTKRKKSKITLKRKNNNKQNSKKQRKQ